MSAFQDKPQGDGEKIRELFRRAEATALEAPPFLTVRIGAELKGRQQVGQRLFRWKAVAAATALAFCLVLFFALPPSGATYTAVAGKPFVVRVELEELKSRDLDYAQIEVPHGVHFFSKEHPEIASLDRMEIGLTEDLNLSNLPFVIESDSIGVKKIRVRLYNRAHELVANKEIKIDFKGGRPAV